MTKRNMIKKAVALHYDADMQTAPEITAKGWGKIAEKIITLARENNIPVVEDKDLTAVLEKIDVYTEIPDDVFAIVAEIYAFLYRLNKENRK